MATKKSKQTKDLEDLLQAEIKPLVITGASIKDEFCDYTYKVQTGVQAGDEHGVKCKNIIHSDLDKAMKVFDRHLAFIDLAFKGADIPNINAIQKDAEVLIYNVTGFQIKGSDENLSIVLIGTKYCNPVGTMGIRTPKIMLNDNSVYKFHDELKEAVDHVQSEVELYREGKYIVQEKIDSDPSQLTILGGIEEAEGKISFEKNKV